MNALAKLLALVLLTTIARGQNEDAAFLEELAKNFEQVRPVPAHNFVPEAQMHGTLHTVRPMADNDGLNNTYYMDTPSGVEAVLGTVAVVARIRELYALDYLRGLSKTEEFRNALTKSIGDKVESAGNIVRDPVKTLRSVPKGASRFFGRIGEGMKGGTSQPPNAQSGSPMGDGMMNQMMKNHQMMQSRMEMMEMMMGQMLEHQAAQQDTKLPK